MISDLYKPYREKGSIMNEMENLMQHHFGSLINTGPLVGEWMLPATVKETGNSVIVTAELPGVESEDIQLSIDGNVLTIRGERKKDPRSAQEHHLGEKGYGSFHHAIRLPSDVNGEQTAARFDQEVLKVTLPKLNTHHQIDIKKY
jgi:HSP20 family protein